MPREITESQNLHEQLMHRGAMLAESEQWKPYMEGLEGPTRDITAVLLENEKQYFDRLDETTKVAQIGNFLKFAFPMVRAIFPQLIAMDIVSVQPMQGPVSLVFYLDFLYGTTKGNILKGDRLYRSGFPLQANDTSTEWDGHDTDYLFSSETVTLEQIIALDGTTPDTVSYTMTYKPTRPTSVELWLGQTRSNAVKIGTSNADGSFTSLGVTVGGQVTSVTGAAGSVNFDTGVISGVSVAYGTLNTTWIIYVTYKYISEGTTQVPEIDLQLQSTAVTADTRKLKANWSVEAANDLRALQNLDVEAELSAVLADEIRFEIDREIITDLIALSTSHGIPVKNFDRTPPSGISYYEHKMNFFDHLIIQSNQIFKMTRRAAGNFLVGGIEVANLIEALPGFQPTNIVGNGVVKIGNLKGQFDVYKDPYMTTTQYVMGYKGPSFLDAGYVFAPYVPLYTTPTFVLADFVGTKGMMTRYGKKTINNRFYIQGAVTGTQI